MNPLTLLYGKRKISGNDLYLSQCLPLMHKRLLLEGKSRNPEIDALFELAYRLVALASLSGNQRMNAIAGEAQKALVAACDVAADKGNLIIAPSTDQKRAICTALDLLAAIAPQLSNELYFKSVLFAEEKIDAYIALRTERTAA